MHPTGPDQPARSRGRTSHSARVRPSGRSRHDRRAPPTHGSPAARRRHAARRSGDRRGSVAGEGTTPSPRNVAGSWPARARTRRRCRRTMRPCALHRRLPVGRVRASSVASGRAWPGRRRAHADAERVRRQAAPRVPAAAGTARCAGDPASGGGRAMRGGAHVADDTVLAAQWAQCSSSPRAIIVFNSLRMSERRRVSSTSYCVRSCS